MSGQAPQAATLPVRGRVPARPVAPGAVNGNVAAGAANGRAAAPGPAAVQAPLQPAPVGTRPAPAISLPDLDGGTRSLEAFRGKNTMLLFWNPGCGFCNRMVDDVKAFEANPPAGAPQLLIVSTGTTEANRAQGLRAPLLLDQGFATGRQFGAGGTPSAVLIDANGNIASGVAVGAPSVLDMAYNRAIPPVQPAAPAQGNGAAPARPTQAQPLAPMAARVGQKAPELKLPDLDGNEIDLADFRGDKTMLLFWNPGCGFCRRMADDLKALEANPPVDAPRAAGRLDRRRRRQPRDGPGLDHPARSEFHRRPPIRRQRHAVGRPDRRQGQHRVAGRRRRARRAGPGRRQGQRDGVEKLPHPPAPSPARRGGRGVR